MAEIQPFSSGTDNAPAPQATDARSSAIWDRLRLRHFTPSGCGVDAVVGAGATSLAVVFVRKESNTDYGVHVIPGWSTTAYVPFADKSTTGFTVRFGTAAPGGGSVMSWSTFRSED